MRVWVAACISAAELQAAVMNAKCDTGCRWAGYSYGYFRDPDCQCVDKREFSRITEETKIRLPSKSIKAEAGRWKEEE